MHMLQPHERLFFIHIPKTAGTTLTPLIDMHFHEREIFPAQLWRELVRVPQEDFAKHRLFRGHFGGNGLNAFLPEPPVCMTMLRHPVPLTISTYKFILREPGTRVHDVVAGRNMSLEDFLDCRKTRNKAADKQTRHLSFDLEHDPESGPIFHNPESRAVVDEWVKDHKVRISPRDRLERAREKLESCRFFGLVERFEESMALMSYAFGWPPIGRVQRLMVAPEKSRKEELSETALERIMAINELDLELYAFAEDLFNRRLAAMYADLERLSAEEPAVAATERAHAINGAAPRGEQSHAERGGFPTDADFELTYRRLDARYLQQQRIARPRRQERVRITFAEPLFGDGWHRREASAIDGSTFRWTGPGRISTIDLPLKAASDVRVTICIINALDDDIREQMRIFINDIEIDMQQIEHRAKGWVYQGLATREMLESDGAVVRLSIEVPRTAQPRRRDPFSDDSREVGVAVSWIDCSPIDLLEEGAMPAALVDREEALRLRDQRRQAILRNVKQRVSQIPIIGPRLREAYIRMKHR